MRHEGYTFWAPSLDVGSFYSIVYQGSYDPILKRLSKADIVVDGGANIGVFSILASQSAHVVYAVEPDPTNFRYLCRNVALNNVSNVVPINAALGPKEGHGFLAGEGEGAHLGVRGRPVLITTIDSISKGAATVIKLDVEGFEVAALLTQQSLRKARLIAVEMDKVGLDKVNREPSLNCGVVGSFDDLTSVLRQEGFTISRQDEVPVDLRSKFRDWSLVANELKTGFFGCRWILLTFLSERRNLLRPETETQGESRYVLWTLYASR